MMRRKNRCIEFCFLENPIFRRISSFGAFRCIEIFDHSTFLKEQLLRVIDIRFKIQILNIKSRWWWNQRVFGCFIDGNRWRNFARWSYRIGFSPTLWLIDWSETSLGTGQRLIWELIWDWSWLKITKSISYATRTQINLVFISLHVSNKIP